VPTEIIVYACNHCGRRYDDVRQAAECEQRHLMGQGRGSQKGVAACSRRAMANGAAGRDAAQAVVVP
jgi:hypothetical protein